MSTPAAPVISVRNLTKSFGPTTVLHGIDLEIGRGEFVGLMGPNGAGKSTLIKIFDGVHEASGGEILLDGKPVRSLAEFADVGFIHQDLGLIDDLSIVDNLQLGERPRRLIGPILDQRAERLAATHALTLVELDIPVDTLVGELSPGEKTLVAVARVLARGARVLFVDEATSTLPPADSRRVIAELAKAASEGATVIMVSHKLSEILDATQRVLLLLDGRLVVDQQIDELDREALVAKLFAHEVAKAEEAAGDHRLHPGDRPQGEVLLELRQACGGRAGPIDLEIREGEATGLTGLPGSGLHDVAFLANGTLPLTSGSAHKRDGLRLALVPPHRETQGGFGDLPVRDNLTVSALRRWTRALCLLSIGRENRDCVTLADRLSLTPRRIDAEFGVLSGGNKQKVIFGRALLREPHVYVLCEPTRGVDLGTRAEIYRLIRELRDQGAGVLIVSSDTEDLLAVCDRIAVVVGGTLSPVRPAEEMQLADLEALV